MNVDLREAIQRSLRTLAATHAAMMAHFEETNELFRKLLKMDPFEFFGRHFPDPPLAEATGMPQIDAARFSVHFRGRTCFLGNTLAFRLFAYLAARPFLFVSHEELLAEVWSGAMRSDSAVRSVMKILRRRLRRDGMTDLAAAIDGSEHSHYAFKPPSQ